jgi:hypothetical protein
MVTMADSGGGIVGQGGSEQGVRDLAGGVKEVGGRMMAGAAFRENIPVEFKKGAGEAFDKCAEVRALV